MKFQFLFIALLCTISLAAQKNETSPFEKFGKVSKSDLEKTVYSIDSNANAVVLSDIGTREIIGNPNGWFSISSKRHKVVHILNNKGYDEASVKVYLYGKGNEEKLASVKGVTYNLENGKIVTTKLDKSGQFKEQLDKNRQVFKFTLPQVKEGSIIEFEYEVVSEYITVPDPWYFQSLTAPTLWSELSFTVPSFYYYDFLFRGYLGLDYTGKENRKQNYMVSDYKSGGRENFDSDVTDYRWVVKNSPELKTENFTSSIFNHISRMEFQLISQGYPFTNRTFRTSWEEITKNLLQSPSFGEKLDASNNWMSDEVKPLFVNETNTLNKAKKIYNYVRDNFKSTEVYGIYLENSLKDIFKNKKGSPSEINLLLTAMLRYAGLNADPVILSTRSNGYSFEYIPMLNSMNYTIVQLMDGHQTYYLDASVPKLGFNQLPVYCYNGHARIVNKNALAVNLTADSITEIKKTVFMVSNSDQGKWVASVSSHLGLVESYNFRTNFSQKGDKEYLEFLQKKYTAKVNGLTLDSLNNFEAPITLKYELDLSPADEDIIYINPTFGEGYSKNPFVNTNRSYPVEMPYAQEEVILSTIDVPTGYVIDELPKQMKVNLDEKGKSFFEYRISTSNNKISFLCRIKITKSFFPPEEYPVLREFFNLVVKKQGEQIVFKKKSS